MLVSLIVLLRELLVSTIFLMMHPYIGIHSVIRESVDSLCRDETDTPMA